MEPINQNKNRSICEKMEGDIDVAEELDVTQKMKVRKDITIVEENMKENVELIEELRRILKEKRNFRNTKKNMFITIRDGLQEVQDVVNKMGKTMIFAKRHFKFVPQGVK